MAEDPLRWLDAIDRAAFIPSPFAHFYGIFSPYRFGRKDSAEKVLFGLLGPAIGDFASLAGALMTGDEKQIAKAVAKVIPVINATAPTREAAEKIIEEILD